MGVDCLVVLWRVGVLVVWAGLERWSVMGVDCLVGRPRPLGPVPPHPSPLPRREEGIFCWLFGW